MTPQPGQDWDELRLSEDPAVDLLSKHLGYTYVAPDALEAERDSIKESVLTKRLARAVQKLNPWLSADNVHKAVRSITTVPAAGLLDANEKLYTALTYGISLEQDLHDGKKGRNIRFFDFAKPQENEFLVTRQYKLQGSKTKILPDLVVFVNGIPLAVIECKSPTLGEKWKGDAIEQLLRYQEVGDSYRERGMPRLFETVQLVIATCGQAAAYGTVLTPHRFFSEWKSPFPRSESELQAALGRPPTPQDILLCGMLAPANLLDLLRNFVVFERDEGSGKTIKKLARYQQFAAVNKAILRARDRLDPGAPVLTPPTTSTSSRSTSPLASSGSGRSRRAAPISPPTSRCSTPRRRTSTPRGSSPAPPEARRRCSTSCSAPDPSWQPCATPATSRPRPARADRRTGTSSWGRRRPRTSSR